MEYIEKVTTYRTTLRYREAFVINGLVEPEIPVRLESCFRLA